MAVACYARAMGHVSVMAEDPGAITREGSTLLRRMRPVYAEIRRSFVDVLGEHEAVALKPSRASARPARR